MHWFRFTVLIILVAVLQASFLADMDIKPDLLLILLVFFAVFCGPGEAIASSFVVGFAADIIGSSMGPQTVSFGICGTILAYLHRVIAIRKMPYQAAAIFVTAILAGTGAHLLGLLKGHTFTPAVLRILLGTAVYSAIVGPFLFLPAAWWMRIRIDRFGRR